MLVQPVLTMDFDQVIISPKCFLVFRAESKKATRSETGGPLVGFIENRKLLVYDADGPGPRSIIEPYSVTIDGKYAQTFCDRALRESKGIIDYVGDWHRHTGFSLQHSDQDIAAMKLMAEFEYSPTKYPISIIYRNWPCRFKVYVWDGSGTLRAIVSKIGKDSDFPVQKQ